MQKPSIVSLNAVTDNRYGGKAEGLAKLDRLGLAVPPAFVITNAMKDVYPDNLEQCYRALRKTGEDLPAVAVRSSAQGEDGHASSYAGQYETVLNVVGLDALKNAINHCVDSLQADRAQAYRSDNSPVNHHSVSEAVVMHIVVQSMVKPRAAGVLFTADPASARRDLVVIDAVAGLGDALVSGEAPSDHYKINRRSEIVLQDLIGDSTILTQEDITTLCSQARNAEKQLGHPLDMEWAIDKDGSLYWLQARPITTLPGDLNELDTPLAGDNHVYTRCNVGEMMPGAVSPMTADITGGALEFAMQYVVVVSGMQKTFKKQRLQNAVFYGHMFFDMTESAVLSSGVLGSSVEQYAISICGRPVPELTTRPLLPFIQRLFNTFRMLRYLMQTKSVVANFEKRLQNFEVRLVDNITDIFTEIEKGCLFYNDAMAVHIRSTAYAAMTSNIIEQAFKKSASTEQEAQAISTKLLAGANDVESALTLQNLDEVVDAIALQADAVSKFQKATRDDALHWLQSGQAGDAKHKFDHFIKRYGHRGYRELCMRDPCWADDLPALIQIMQAILVTRTDASIKTPKRTQHDDVSGQLNFVTRKLLANAHAGIRGRENTKSKLADVANRLKRGFRHLGGLLAKQNLLPDADLIFFLTYEELSVFMQSPSDSVIAKAIARREALKYQDKLEFSDVCVGKPEPILAETRKTPQDGIAHGRPVSQGVVEGKVRVALTLSEAAALQPGEILVTPITDIGWTPYFSLIGGLVTDVGSAISHGAIIAREYGLPCVVNVGIATKYFKTGDVVRLNGNDGTVTLIK